MPLVFQKLEAEYAYYYINNYMENHVIDKDFIKFQNKKTDINPALLPAINLLFTVGFRKKKISDDVITFTKKIPGYKGAPISVTVFEPKDIGNNAPCLIFIHGGAFYLKAAPYHKYLVSEYARKTPCKVVLADYRLIPKYPFPIGLEDCYAAFEWVCNNADSLGVDINRIAIGGDSAGGALAAAITHMVRDRNAPKICFQMLIYPMTDNKKNAKNLNKYNCAPNWDPKAYDKMWERYLRNGDFGQRAYVAPIEASNFTGLSDAYIEVSEFDFLRDEGIRYAEALEKCGCQVELNKTVGTVHVFELAEQSHITTECINSRVKALQKVFYVDR